MGDQTDVVEQVLTQLKEIYSPENLAKDAFFKEMTEQDPEGWVSLKRFGAIKRFKTIIDGNLDYFIQAAERSNGLFLMNEEKTKLRKIPEEVLEKEKKEAQMESKKQEFMDYISLQNARSIYAKGFATNADKEKISKFFAEFGRVLRLKMRMDEQKKFKGSVFVEFESNEVAESVAAKEDLKFDDKPLELMMKQAYVDMKAEEKYSGQEWKGHENPIKYVKHLVEYEGAKGMSFKEIKELIRTKAEVLCVEPLEGEGRGVVQLAKTPVEVFLKSLEDNKLGALTFRFADESSAREFRKARESHDKNYRGTKRKQGGDGGRGGRGGHGGHRGRGGGRGRGGRGDKRQRTENSASSSPSSSSSAPTVAAAAGAIPPVIQSSSSAS